VDGVADVIERVRFARRFVVWRAFEGRWSVWKAVRRSERHLLAGPEGPVIGRENGSACSGSVVLLESDGLKVSPKPDDQGKESDSIG
jgi:hypothetical protein